MAIAEDRFFETRAVQMAIVQLTGRDDVQVIREPQDYGVDLTVSLLEEGKNVGRLLAVEIKAVSTGKQLQTARFSEQQDTSFQSFRLPLCLFVFSMDDDRGYWRWVRKPVTDPNTQRRLITEQQETLHPLTTDAMSQILKAVRDWYGV